MFDCLMLRAKRIFFKKDHGIVSCLAISIFILVLSQTCFAKPKYYASWNPRSLAGRVRQNEMGFHSHQQPFIPRASVIKSSAPVCQDDQRLVKILILKQQDQVKIGISSGFDILHIPNQQRVAHGYFLATKTVKADPREGFWFADQHYRGEGLRFATHRAGTATVNGQRYKGFIEVRVNPQDHRLDVINTVSMRDLLQVTVCREVPPSWPSTVLQAQAIISRSYTYYKVFNKKNPQELYDLTTRDVYYGPYREDTRSSRAVQVTDGMVMTYNGQLFPTFYFATCGGRTEDAVTVWEDQDVACLKSVECSYCRNAPHWQWRAEINPWDIVHRMQDMPGASSHGLAKIQILKRSATGRVTWLALHYRDGRVLRMSGNTFRLKMDPDVIRSTQFKLSYHNKSYIFEGLGWGHGVGLCQWGAKGLAETEQMKSIDILSYYYPGAEFSILNWQRDPKGQMYAQLRKIPAQRL